MDTTAIKIKLQAQFEEELFTNNFNLSHDEKMLVRLEDEKAPFVVKAESLASDLANKEIFADNDTTKETRDKKKAMVIELGKVRQEIKQYEAIAEKLTAAITMAQRRSATLTDKIEYLKTYEA